MKELRLLLFLCTLLPAATGAKAQSLEWQAVQNLHKSTWISVSTVKTTHCEFQGATDDQLFCTVEPQDWHSAISTSIDRKRRKALTFCRADIRSVQIVPFDYSKDPLDLLAAVGAGSGLDFARQPVSFAGLKIGGPFSLDLQYDRTQARNGFSMEGSAVIPLFRLASPQRSSDKAFLRLYAEPGIGYRAGGGNFGGYSSAKAMILLWNPPRKSDAWPYMEYQRRFPFESPLDGDNRLTFGFMLAICGQCGID
jgi:hypothetical protein